MTSEKGKVQDIVDRMPDPRGGPPSPNKPQDEDDADQLLRDISRTRRKAMREAAQMQTERQVLEDMGIMQPRQREQPVVSSPFNLQANIDLGAIVNGSQKMLTDMATQFATSMSAEQKARMETMQRDLETMRAKLEQPPQAQTQQSPLEVYREIHGLMNEVSSNLKKELGIGEAVRTSPSDLPAMLELERVRLENTRSQQQFQLEFQKRDHEFQMGMKKWQEEMDTKRQQWTAEFNLKKLEFEESRSSRQRTGAIFQDLAGALASSIDSGQEAAAPVVASSGPSIQSFECENCHSPVEVPRPEESAVTCTSCGQQYKRK